LDYLASRKFYSLLVSVSNTIQRSDPLREPERRASDWIRTASILANLNKPGLATGRKLLIDVVFTLRDLWVLNNDVIQHNTHLQTIDGLSGDDYRPS
jgi:hypothetical protein